MVGNMSGSASTLRPPSMAQIQDALTRAESHALSDETACGVWLRIFADRASAELVEAAHQPLVHRETLHDRLARLERIRGAPSEILVRLHAIREAGNEAAHGRAVRHIGLRVADAHTVMEYLGSATSSRPAPRPTEQAGSDVRSGNVGELVVADPDGVYLIRYAHSTSAVCVRGGRVEVIAEQVDRLLFGEGAHLWEWQRTTEYVPILADNDVRTFVDAIDEDDRRSFRDRATWIPVEAAHLVNLRTGRTHPPAPAPGPVEEVTGDDALDDPTGVGCLTQRSAVRVLASVGRYVLRFDLDDGDFGGAHNIWGCRFTVFDTVEGREVDLLTQVRAAVDEHPRLLAEAWRALEAESLGSRETLEVTLFSFRFSDGAVYLDCQVTTDACHAMSDMRWDDYTCSTFVKLTDLPPALRSYAQIPSVVDWHRLQDPSAFAGWSVLDLSMEAIVRAQLQSDDRFG